MKTAGALLFVTLSVTLTAMGHNAAAQSDLAGDILLDDAYFEQFDAANTAGLLKNAPIREAAHQKIQGQAPPRPFDGATGVSSLSTGMGGVIENGSFTWTMEDMALSKVTFDADGNPLSSYTTTAGRQMDTMRKLEIGPFSKESDRSQDFSRSVDANGDSYFSRYDFYVDGVHRAHLEFNPDGTIRTGWVKNADGSINSSWTPRAEEPSSASARPPSGGARGSQRSPRPRVQVTKLGGGN
ncbi:MAG TPA: hypothetical protein VEC60_17525, partial [Reyranella sp.]|nr:hypothetical protein [Reyranella sp.]